MYDRRKPLKSEWVADELRRRIQEHGFPDGRLPRKSELVEFFQVSQITIEAALKTLTAEGLIHGVRGTGIFINDDFSHGKIDLTHRLVMVVMHLSGHFFGDFYETMREKLLRRSLFPVTYSMDDSMLRLANVSAFLSAPIQGVIYHGISYWRYPFLKSWKNLKSVALDWYDADGAPAGGAALVDYVSGGYELARHLLQRGCQRLAFLHSQIPAEAPMTDSFRHNHMVYQLQTGINLAISECGAQPLNTFPVSISPTNDDLKAILKQPFDGILCSSDAIAHWVKIEAQAMGKACPRDFLLTGNLNTPWSSETDLPLTTLDINTDKICQAAIQLLDSGKRETITITPTPIWRQSTQD